MAVLNLLALAVALGIFLHGAHRVVVRREPLSEHWPSMLVAAGYSVAFAGFGFFSREVALWLVLFGLGAALPGFAAQIWRGRRRK